MKACPHMIILVGQILSPCPSKVPFYSTLTMSVYGHRTASHVPQKEGVSKAYVFETNSF
jgi:hypothetical protein